MKNPIFKLESIFAQASNNHNPQQFFQLLHEFAIALQNPIFHEAIKQIQAKEQKMKRWINKVPHKPSSTAEELYINQYQTITPWYGLNQIRVFWERYDFALYDMVIQDLDQKNINSNDLKNEHVALMNYALTGIRSSIFPTIEEYKHYMRRVIDALSEILHDSISVTTHPFIFNRQSNELVIEGFPPIRFMRSTNTSVLLGFLKEKRWRNIDLTDVGDALGLEYSTIKRAIRQINDRLPDNLPSFLLSIDHESDLKKKIITVSGAYKK